MTGIRHANDCPNARGTADPWQSDLIRTVIRVDRAASRQSMHYRCPHCRKGAVQVEPYEPQEG